MDFAAIDRVASAQFGVINRRQVLLFMSPGQLSRRIEGNLFDRMHHGVYRMAGAPDSWRQRLMMAILARPTSVASHRAAAYLHGWLEVEPEIELTMAFGREPALNKTVTHRSRNMTHRTILQGIPVTTPARTLLDLAAVLSRKDLRKCLDRALRSKSIHARRFEDFLEVTGTQGRKGATFLRRLVSERNEIDSQTESELEAELLQLIRRAGLPEPTPQVVIDTGFSKPRVDLAYPDKKLVVEADSWMFHSSREAFDRDRERDAELAAIGWRTLPWTKRSNDGPFIAALRLILLGESGS